MQRASCIRQFCKDDLRKNWSVSHSLRFIRLEQDAFDTELMTHGIGKVKSKMDELNNKQTPFDEDEFPNTLEVVYEFYLRGYDFVSVDFFDGDTLQFLIVDDMHLKLMDHTC